MKIKPDYDRVIDELKAVHIILPYKLIQYIFREDQFIREFSDCKGINQMDAAAIILSKSKRLEYKKLLKRIIHINNVRIKSMIPELGTVEKIKETITKNKTMLSHDKALLTYCLFFYYLSHNIFQGEIYEFLKKKSESYTKIMLRIGKKNSRKQAKYIKVSLGEQFEGTKEEKFFNSCFNDDPDLQITKDIPIKEIEDDLHCEYDPEKKVFNNVRKGILYYIKTHIIHYKEEMTRNTMHYNFLMSEFAELNKRKEKLEITKDLLDKSKDKIYHLEHRNKSLKKEIKKLNNIVLTRNDKSSNKDLENQNYNLKKDNYYLQTRLEKLEEQVAVFEEEKRLNTELSDNITIEEKPVTKQVNKPEYMNIVVAGGRWTSDNREKVCLYLPDNEIEFIEADKILRNYDKIANCDIIFFDTSYNSHAYYYKLKKCSGDFYHINASNLLEFEKIYENE